MEPAVHRLSPLDDGPETNAYLLELGFPAVNIRGDMALAEDVRISQYGPFIFSHTHKVMPIRFICFGLAVRFVRIKMGI